MIIPTMVFFIKCMGLFSDAEKCIINEFHKTMANFHQTKMTKYTSDTYREKKELVAKLSNFLEE